MNNEYRIMRHGESLANREALIVSRPENALEGYGLTAKGAAQVKDSVFRASLSDNVVIVSSDFLRARETAQIVFDCVGGLKPITLMSELRERNFGDWELGNHSNYNKVWIEDERNPHRSINSVETVFDTLDRGVKVLQELEKRYKSQSILLVGHGDVLQILNAHYCGVGARLHRSMRSLENAEIRSINCRFNEMR